MTASLDMIRGRSNIVTLTNNSGGALVAGDVVVQDTTADEKVTTTTSAASTLKVFVAAESIASGATGRFYESGYCPLVNVNASVTRGRFLFTHTVAKQAAENATYGSGAFGKILKSGTTPSAIIYSATAQTTPGGSGNATYNSAYASPPSTPADGDMWYPSDGLLTLRYNGSAWIPIGPLYPVWTKPVIGDFTWTNQGSNTATDYGGIEIVHPAESGVHTRAFLKNSPARPYTIDVAMRLVVSGNNYHSLGFCWSDGTGFIIAGTENVATGSLIIYKFASITSGDSGSYVTINYWSNRFSSGIYFLRLQEDNTNRTVSVSGDGRNYFQVHQIGRTDFITATKVGVAIHSEEAVYPDVLHLLSWKES